MTVCPDWATDQLAIQTIYNMIEFDDKVKPKLEKTLEEMRRGFYEVSNDRSDVPWELKKWGWIVDFSPDSVTNLRLRKDDDIMNFALNHEGNLYNALFNKVKFSRRKM